jgi:hypothetical protein
MTALKNIFVFILLSISTLAISAEKKYQAPTLPVEVLNPNSVQVSKDVIKINKTFLRDLASGQEEKKVKAVQPTSDDIPFWYMEDNKKSN